MEKILKRERASKIIDQLTSLLMPRILATTAPLYRYDGNIMEPFASALIIRLGDEHFLLTAAHVRDDLSKFDLYFGSTGMVRLCDYDYWGYACSPPGEDDKIDIAIFHVSKQTAGELKKEEFLTLSDLEILGQVSTACFFVFGGYPVSKNRPSRSEDIRADLRLFLVDSAPPKDYENAGLDPNFSLLLRFNKNKVWGPSGRTTAPDLYGISGGGVWSFNNQSTSTESTPRLVAIAIEWWKGQKRILATKVHVALEMIYDRFPNLRQIDYGVNS